MQFIVAALAALTFCVGCQTTRPPSPRALTAAAPMRGATYPKRLMAAKTDFYAAVAGDRDALPRALKALDDLGGADSGDPQVVAYLGASRLLEAAHAIWPWEKADLGKKGLALEDRAVAEAPGDLEVRFLRGVTSYQLPRFMGRWDQGVSDLTEVAQVAERAADAGRLDPRAAAADLDYYGKIREARYDSRGAIAAWLAAVRISPDSPGGKDASKHLDEHHVVVAARAAD